MNVSLYVMSPQNAMAYLRELRDDLALKYRSVRVLLADRTLEGLPGLETAHRLINRECLPELVVDDALAGKRRILLNYWARRR